MSSPVAGVAQRRRFRVRGVVQGVDCWRIVAPDVALRAHPVESQAGLIGEVRAEPEGLVMLDTALGGRRIVDMLVGDPLPRIC